MNRSVKRPILLITFWLACLAVLIRIVGHHPLPKKPLPLLWPVPAFDITGVTTQGEQPLRQKDLLGHPWVADFVFTSCGGPCPIMSSKMAALQRILPPTALLVSFTVDPDHDTVPVLREYAARFHADPSRWVFGRTDQKTMYGLIVQGFRLAVAERHEDPPETRVMHSTLFVLIDPQGVVRGFYDSNGPSVMENIRQDVGRLITENR
jgi:protein SCO1/2